MIIDYSAISHVGNIRTENQDRIYVDNSVAHIDENGYFKKCGRAESYKSICFAVFDGMGGEQEGDVAATIAAESFLELTEDRFDFKDVCLDINKRICDYMQENNVRRMGTTAAILRFDNWCVDLCNIGDSRIYRLSGDSFERISVDHTVTVNNGYRNVKALTQHLGIPEKEMGIEPNIDRFTYKNEDVYLICSDGLSDMLTEKKMQELIQNNDISEAANALCEEALKNGGRDNVSIIVCKLID